MFHVQNCTKDFWCITDYLSKRLEMYFQLYSMVFILFKEVKKKFMHWFCLSVYASSNSRTKFSNVQKSIYANHIWYRMELIENVMYETKEALMRPLLMVFFEILLFLSHSADDHETQTEQSTMVDLVAVKQHFRKIIREWLWRQKCSLYFFAKTIYLNTNYSEILHVNSLSIIK